MRRHLLHLGPDATARRNPEGKLRYVACSLCHRGFVITDGSNTLPRHYYGSTTRRHTGGKHLCHGYPIDIPRSNPACGWVANPAPKRPRRGTVTGWIA